MTDSWWLKVKRAQKHIIDIERAAREYAGHHPYEFRRLRYPDHQLKVGFQMRITQQPDPMIAVVLGDFVHNLRSALDHVIVACTPKKRWKSASFPILFEDIWEKDRAGDFVVNDAQRRADLETAVGGLPDGARAVVIRTQPYHHRGEAYRDALGIISRVENADKHRQLITVGGGVQNLVRRISIRGYVVTLPHEMGMDHFAKDNTQVGIDWTGHPWPGEPNLKASEVDVQYTGTATVFIKITRIGGNEPPSEFPLRLTMLTAIQEVRRALRLLEPFAIR